MVINNDNGDNDECCICFDKKISKSTSCDVCNTSVCMNCFEKIYDVEFNEKTKKSKIKISCVVCRSEFNKNSKQFTRAELVCLSTSLINQYGDSWNFFIDSVLKYKKQYNQLASIAKQKGINFNEVDLPEYV